MRRGDLRGGGEREDAQVAWVQSRLASLGQHNVIDVSDRVGGPGLPHSPTRFHPRVHVLLDRLKPFPSSLAIYEPTHTDAHLLAPLPITQRSGVLRSHEPTVEGSTGPCDADSVVK
jgi:hypothetical protein